MSLLKHFIIFSIMFATSFGCQGCKHQPEEQIKTPMAKGEKFHTDSFIFIKTDIEVLACTPGASKCNKKTNQATSSGFLFDYNEKEDVSMVVTAKHVCEHSPPPLFMDKEGDILLTVDINIQHTLLDEGGKIIKDSMMQWTSEDYDICVLYVPGKIGGEPIKIAQKAPEKGESVYNVSAPGGIWSSRVTPIFSGLWIGEVKKSDISFKGVDFFKDTHYIMTSIPAVPGASGSPILNNEGELVSMVFAIPNVKQYTHLSFGIPFQVVKIALPKAKEILEKKLATETIN